MAQISFTAAVQRDGSIDVLYAGTDAGAAHEAMEKGFEEADPAEVSEIHFVRNAQPFQRRFLELPAAPAAEGSSGEGSTPRRRRSAQS
jgi:hypothetical protein